MKTISSIITTAALALLVVQGCKKEEIINEPNPATGSSSIGAFFTQNGVPSQTLNVDAATGGFYTGNQGTRLYIYPNSFVTLTNQPVSGTVQLELKEILNRTDMILSDAHTLSNNNLLESGGELYLNATQGGQKLKLAAGKSIYVVMPTTTTQDMNLFYGTRTSQGVNWNLAASTPTITANPDSSQTSGWAYPFSIDSLNWINMDVFYSDPNPKTKVKVNVSAGYDSSNTAVFVVFNSKKMISRVYSYTPGEFNTNYYTLPTGMNVNIVAISKQNGQYYSAFSGTTTITNNHAVALTFYPTTESAFKSALQGLP